MHRDPTEFRKRFAAWKDGKKPYEAELPTYKVGKTPHELFVEQMGPVLYKELLRTNTPNIDTAYDHMLRQLAYESDYGRSRVARQQHNYGGYGWNGKTYTTFKDDEDFVRHYVLLMNKRYGAAVNADSVQAYGKALKDSGYYEDTLSNYTRNLVGMKSLSRSAAAHKLSNPNLYQIKPLALTPAAEQLESTPQFQPVNIVVPEINTDYSLLNASIQSPAPQSINAWVGADSPAYGGASLRMPSLLEYMQTGNIMPHFKDGKLPGYAIGTPDNEEVSDATYVLHPMIVRPIKRNFIAEAQKRHAAEAVGPDTRSSYQRKQSLAAKLYANKQYLKAKDDARRAEGLELMMATVSPSTYVEAATGLDLGTAGRLITDAVAFGLPGAAKSIARSTMQYGRKLLLSQTMRPLNKNISSVAARSGLKENPYTYNPLNTKDLFEKMRVFYTKLALSSIEDMPMGEYSLVSGVSHFQGIPQTAEDVLRYQVLPRTNYFKQKYDEIIDGLKRYGYNTGSDGAFATAGEKAGTAGFFDPDTKGIALKEGFVDFAGPHEFRHRMQVLFPYRNSMAIDRKSYLTRAYDDLFDDLPNLVEKSDDLYGYPNMALEKETTNLDARRYALENFTDDVEMPYKPVSELNAFLDGLSDDLILEAVEKSNGYGRRFVHFIKNPNEAFANGPLNQFYSTFPKRIGELRLGYADAFFGKGTDVSNLDYDQIININDRIKTRYAKALRNAMKYYGMFTGGAILSMPTLSQNDR